MASGKVNPFCNIAFVHETESRCWKLSEGRAARQTCKEVKVCDTKLALLQWRKEPKGDLVSIFGFFLLILLHFFPVSNLLTASTNITVVQDHVTPSKMPLRGILKSSPIIIDGMTTPESIGKRRRSAGVLSRVFSTSSRSPAQSLKKSGSYSCKSKSSPEQANKNWSVEYERKETQPTPSRVRFSKETPERSMKDYLSAMHESETSGVLCKVRLLINFHILLRLQN